MGDMPSNRIYERQCQICRADFTASRRDARYCSHTCASRSHRSRSNASVSPPGYPVTVTSPDLSASRRCRTCNTSIEHKRRDAQFCSKNCASLAWYYEVGRPARDQPARHCPTCDGPVSEERHANAVFCSVLCREVNRRVAAYGLTLYQYKQLLVSQRSACAVCGCGEIKWKTDLRRDGWHIDHDHETGAVRGILCPPCNLMIGYAKDRPDVLVAAANYLRRTVE